MTLDMELAVVSINVNVGKLLALVPLIGKVLFEDSTGEVMCWPLCGLAFVAGGLRVKCTYDLSAAV